MNLKPDEIYALIQNYAQQVGSGKLRRDIDGLVPLRRSELVETIERMLQLAKELP